VTDLTGMFRGAIQFNGNLRQWNISNVTTMNSMFAGASRFDGYVSPWDVGNVKGHESDVPWSQRIQTRFEFMESSN
jgi:hypothetical protein